MFWCRTAKRLHGLQTRVVLCSVVPGIYVWPQTATKAVCETGWAASSFRAAPSTLHGKKRWMHGMRDVLSSVIETWDYLPMRSCDTLIFNYLLPGAVLRSRKSPKWCFPYTDFVAHHPSSFLNVHCIYSFCIYCTQMQP